MRSFVRGALAASGLLIASAAPSQAFCTNPNALGVSRVLPLESAHGLEVGRNGFHNRLPLQPKEVVLTFDDGPDPGSTDAVLRALDHQCTLATFFIVGKMARAHPSVVLATEAAGHTIGTHSHGHPLDLQRRPVEDGIGEIEGGIRDVGAVLGHAPAPFFRFPGLIAPPPLRAHLAERGIAAISIDAEGGDWLPMATPDQIRQRALSQLRAANGGILLLHDTKAATVAMLPQLLWDLQAEGFHIVHIVPSAESLVAAAGSAPAKPPAKRAPTAAVAQVANVAPAPTLASSSARPVVPVRTSAPPPWPFQWSRPFDPTVRPN